MEKKFTFTMTEQQLAVISAGLSELPMKIAAPVLNDMQAQYAAQVAKEPASETPHEPESPASTPQTKRSLRRKHG